MRSKDQIFYFRFRKLKLYRNLRSKQMWESGLIALKILRGLSTIIIVHFPLPISRKVTNQQMNLTLTGTFAVCIQERDDVTLYVLGTQQPGANQTRPILRAE